MDNNGTIEIEMTAVVLGANDTLIDLEMPYGYRLVREKLKGSCLENEVLQRDDTVNVQYYASNLGTSEDPEFVFIHKKQFMEVGLEFFSIDKMLTGNTETYIYFDELTSQWNRELFNLLTMLRLSQEGNIEIADKRYSIVAQYKCNKVKSNSVVSLDTPISVYDDLYQWSGDGSETFEMMKSLPPGIITEFQDVFSRFESGYSISRIEDAYKDLITLAEIILIGYNSRDQKGDKKIKLSNRIAAAISDDASADLLKDKIRQIYKERSDETHEGDAQNINAEELKLLRGYIRKLIVNCLTYCNDNYESFSDKSFKGMKKEYVQQLLSRVEDLKSKGLLTT